MLINDLNKKDHDDKAMKKKSEEAREQISKENELIRLENKSYLEMNAVIKDRMIALEEENK